MTLKQIIKKRGIQVDEVWWDNLEYLGVNGYEAACYIGDGVSIYPCGHMVDDDVDPNEQEHCCNLCSDVRALIC